MNVTQPATWYVDYACGNFGNGASLRYRSDSITSQIPDGYQSLASLNTPTPVNVLICCGLRIYGITPASM